MLCGFSVLLPARDGDAQVHELWNRSSCLGLDWGDPAPHCWQWM